MFLAILALLLMGCEIKVEIPIKHAGVVITNDGEVKDEVLRPGAQTVRTDSRVIVYDVSHGQRLENNFDFLFKDVSRGDLKLAIEFTPIVDSLPSLYRNYESIYVDTFVDTKSRSIVRNLMRNYKPEEPGKAEFKAIIIEALTNNQELTSYVKVHRIEVIDLRW